MKEVKASYFYVLKETLQISSNVSMFHALHRSQEAQEAVEIFDSVCKRRSCFL